MAEQLQGQCHRVHVVLRLIDGRDHAGFNRVHCILLSPYLLQYCFFSYSLLNPGDFVLAEV